MGHILAAAGAGFENVVEFTTYVVGRPSVQGFIQGRNEVFPEIYPSGGYPPNTLLVVDGLVSEDLLVEIKAVAAPLAPVPASGHQSQRRPGHEITRPAARPILDGGETWLTKND